MKLFCPCFIGLFDDFNQSGNKSLMRTPVGALRRFGSWLIRRLIAFRSAYLFLDTFCIVYTLAMVSWLRCATRLFSRVLYSYDTQSLDAAGKVLVNRQLFALCNSGRNTSGSLDAEQGAPGDADEPL